MTRIFTLGPLTEIQEPHGIAPFQFDEERAVSYRHNGISYPGNLYMPPYVFPP